MAKIIAGLAVGLSGKVDGLSFYKMRGVEETVVRKSSGHTKEKVQNHPKFDRVRRETSEFGGRAKASKYLMRGLFYQKPMADHNIAGPLTALLKPVQALDTVSDYSQRGILLSAHPHYIKGFSLNKKHPFDSVVRYPVTAMVDRETLSARVSLPALMPGLNFVPPVSHPYYAFCVSLAIVPDIVYGKNGYGLIHPGYAETGAAYTDTNWFPLLKGSPATEVAITSNVLPPDTNFTMMLAVGIMYGVLRDDNYIERAPYVGSAKVLEVG